MKKDTWTMIYGICGLIFFILIILVQYGNRVTKLENKIKYYEQNHIRNK